MITSSKRYISISKNEIAAVFERIMRAVLLIGSLVAVNGATMRARTRFHALRATLTPVHACALTRLTGFSTPLARPALHRVPAAAAITMNYQVNIDQRLDACMSEDGCDIDAMDGALSDLRAEAGQLADRSQQIKALIAYLETKTFKQADSPNLAGMPLTDAAQVALEQGAPIPTIQALIDELRQASLELQQNGNNHDYVDQLIGALNTQRDRAISAGYTGGRL